MQRTDLPTTLALAELGADGAASYGFYTEGTSAPAVLPGPLAGGIAPSARAFLTGSLGLVLEPMASTLESVALGVPADRIVMLDPNARPSITRDPDAWRARIARVMARADIVKASTAEGTQLVEAPPVAVVDTVGAGDTFGGAFLACLVNEGVGPDGLGDTATVLRAARFAVRASAFVCGRAGANPPTLAELGGWPRA